MILHGHADRAVEGGNALGLATDHGVPWNKESVYSEHQQRPRRRRASGGMEALLPKHAAYRTRTPLPSWIQEHEYTFLADL